MAARGTLRPLPLSMEMTVQVGTHPMGPLPRRYSTDEYQELSEVTNGIRHEYAVLNVDACGTIDGLPAAWIHVDQTGLVTFSNQNGDQASCTLDNGFKVGSSCISSGLTSAHSSSLSSVPIMRTASVPSSKKTSTSVVASTCACSANRARDRFTGSNDTVSRIPF